MSDRLTELEAKIAEASRMEALAQAKSDAARERKDAALERLKDEFGVSTVEEAEALLQKLDTELAKELQAAETALEASL